MLWNCCIQLCQQNRKIQQWPQDWKRSVLIPIPKKGSDKDHSNYLIIALISHSSKVMLQILQGRLQQYVNWEFPDVQAGFRKDRGTRDQIANIHWIIEPDILECVVKWALESITVKRASGGDGIRLAISNPERWCCEGAAPTMPANLENSGVATGLEKVSFYSNPKERQWQRMLELLYNCTHLTH